MKRFTKLALAAALPTALVSLVALAQNATAPASNAGHAGRFAHELKKLDTDGDGRISLDEFVAGATARFKAADVGNSGALTASQIATSPLAQKRDARIASMLVKHLDTAGKGYVTADDFAAAAQKRFASIDAQGTGKVTLERFAAARPGKLERLAFAIERADSPTASNAHAGLHQKFAQAAFVKLDANGDGTLTRDEFVAAARAKFAALDTGHAGKLSAAQIAASPAAQQRDFKLAEHIVKKLDANGDGSVSLAEFQAGAKARFGRLDRSGDGYIDVSDIGARHGHHDKGAQPNT